MPVGTLGVAVEAARELGHEWIGGEHLLVALATRSDSGAGRALAATGVTRDRLLDHLRRLVTVNGVPMPNTSGATPSLNPSAYKALGCAVGLAVSASRSKADEVDLLLALLYIDGMVGDHLRLLGTSPRNVAQELRRLGVETPSQDPPGDANSQ
jgi:ATP-dependent Clp protease ATP-binding subunit ClpC